MQFMQVSRTQKLIFETQLVYNIIIYIIYAELYIGTVFN